MLERETLIVDDKLIALQVAKRMVLGHKHTWPGSVIYPNLKAQRLDDAITSPAAVWAQGWRYAEC